MALDNIGEAIAQCQGAYIQIEEAIASMVLVADYMDELVLFNVSMGARASIPNMLKQACVLIQQEQYTILDHLDVLIPSMMAYANGDAPDGGGE